MATASPFRFFQLRRLTRAVAISLTALLFGGPAFGQTVAELQPQVSIKVKKDGRKNHGRSDSGQADHRGRPPPMQAGKVTEKTVCPLDDRNLAMGAVHYDAKGNVWYKETFHRDASDRVTQNQLHRGRRAGAGQARLSTFKATRSSRRKITMPTGT